ncbi:unnamed protein product, partial [Polarella glacialis]
LGSKTYRFCFIGLPGNHPATTTATTTTTTTTTKTTTTTTTTEKSWLQWPGCWMIPRSRRRRRDDRPGPGSGGRHSCRLWAAGAMLALGACASCARLVSCGFLVASSRQWGSFAPHQQQPQHQQQQQRQQQRQQPGLRQPVNQRPWGRAQRGASSFEQGLPLEEMLRSARQRQAAPSQGATSPPESVSSSRGLRVSLPCVFSSREQPAKEIGGKRELQFFEGRYLKLWAFAKAQTGGAVAVRYASGSQAHAFWPAVPGAASLTGLSLGVFNCSVVKVHPFPLVRLLLSADEMVQAEASGSQDASCGSPAELHSSLRSLDSVEAQQAALSRLQPGERLALLHWLAAGGSEGL